jgi:DNA-binding transcriptional MerR regulator/methylmalonyl-CoA mutase cobalamin-binding subunit
MRVVTRRTGLSAEILRVWERRYRVVTPARTQTGRRLYSDAEIERLHLLHRASLGGRSIGLIAALPDAALEELLRKDAEADMARTAWATTARGTMPFSASRIVTDGLGALERFDPETLGAVLRRASIALPVIDFLEDVVAPLLDQVGTRWREGTLRPAHGHLVATVVRRVLEQSTVTAPATAPRLLLATLIGQAHELGAIMAGTAAAAEGWAVIWLGSNLPASDIADAALRLRVHAVGLSLVHPTADVVVSDELRRLHALLPRSTTMLVGGAAAAGYTETLEEIGVTPLSDVSALVTRLRDLAGTTRGRGKARKDSQRRGRTSRSP